MHIVAPDYLFAERTLWTVVFWASFLLLFAMTSWVQSRERNVAPGDNRDRGSKPVIYIVSVIGMAGAFAAPAVLPAARIALPATAVFATAMAMFWFGFFLYLWAVRTLGTFFRTSVQLLEGQHLVRRGPYRVLRHPAYTGGVLLYAGVGLAIGNWISAGIAPLAALLAYAWRIRVEEAALREKFGAEFEEHRKRTWAIIPLLW